jgi:hypothetical protein
MFGDRVRVIRSVCGVGEAEQLLFVVLHLLQTAEIEVRIDMGIAFEVVAWCGQVLGVDSLGLIPEHEFVFEFVERFGGLSETMGVDAVGFFLVGVDVRFGVAVVEMQGVLGGVDGV